MELGLGDRYGISKFYFKKGGKIRQVDSSKTTFVTVSATFLS